MSKFCERALAVVPLMTMTSTEMDCVSDGGDDVWKGGLAKDVMSTSGSDSS